MRTRSAPQAATRSRRDVRRRGDGPAGGAVVESVGRFLRARMELLMSVILQRALAETLGELFAQTVVFDYRPLEELAEQSGDDRRRRSGTRRGRPIGESGLSATALGRSDRRAIITEALHKIDDLTARLEIAEQGETEPIAVVGIGCRLPGGVSSADEYWQLLQDARSGIVRVPADRWDADEFYAEDRSEPGTVCTRDSGFLPPGSRMSSMRSSSGSVRVRLRRWIPSSDWCSRWPGKPWSTQAFRPDHPRHPNGGLRRHDRI